MIKNQINECLSTFCFVFQKSFEAIPSWLRYVHKYAPPDIQIALVANKIDLVHMQSVDPQVSSYILKFRTLSDNLINKMLISFPTKNHHHHHRMLTVWIPLTLSHTISPYQPLHLVSPLNGTQCLHRVGECKICWLANTGVSMCRRPYEKVEHVFVLTPLAVPLDSLWDGRLLAIQLLFCKMLKGYYF